MGVLYTGKNSWLSRTNLLILTSTGFFVLLLVFTTEETGFFWRNISLNTRAVPPMLQYDYSPGFWIFMSHASVLTCIGLGLKQLSLLKSPRLHRRQFFTLTFSIVILITAVGMSLLDISPSAHINLQPYAFLLVCITTSWGAYRLRKGDILPIA